MRVSSYIRLGQSYALLKPTSLQKTSASEIALRQTAQKALEQLHEAATPLARAPPKANVQSTISKSGYAAQIRGDLAHIPMSLEKCESAIEGHDLREIRKSLPAWDKRQEVLSAVQDYQVTLLSGETGCGKSTQVPQFLLDANPHCNILVAQPRKIAAISLCKRVQEERGWNSGAQQEVGFHVPLERHRGGKGSARLTFCTTGLLRKRLFTDPELRGVTHIVFDEVHERDKLADFALIFIRDLVGRGGSFIGMFDGPGTVHGRQGTGGFGYVVGLLWSHVQHMSGKGILEIGRNDFGSHNFGKKWPFQRYGNRDNC